MTIAFEYLSLVKKTESVQVHFTLKGEGLSIQVHFTPKDEGLSVQRNYHV